MSEADVLDGALRRLRAAVERRLPPEPRAPGEVIANLAASAEAPLRRSTEHLFPQALERLDIPSAPQAPPPIERPPMLEAHPMAASGFRRLLGRLRRLLWRRR